MDQPIPFIQFSGNKFVVEEKASQLLANLKGKIAVVIVAGPYRTGKSYLLNRLLGRQSGFAVAGSINACTKGIWLWGRPVQRGDTTYIFLDSEGLSSLDQSAQFDVQIFSLAVLLSSLFVLNTQGTINEAALEQLELVVQCTNQIRVRDAADKKAASEAELAEHFPHFLWVLRDFVLQLQDPKGNPITPREYLEEALRPQQGNRKGLSEKNRIRQTVAGVFPNRDCFTLVRPVQDEKDLQALSNIEYERLRPEFRKQMADLQHLVYSSAKPKAWNNVLLNGPAFVRLAKTYVESLNGGSIPTIHSAWQSVVALQSREALENAFQQYSSRFAAFDQNEKVVAEDEQLTTQHAKEEAEAVALFHSHSVGDPVQKQTGEGELRRRLAKLHADRIQRNNTRSELACREVLEELFQKSGMESKLNKGYASFEAFEKDRVEFAQAYFARVLGPMKEVVYRKTWERKSANLMKTLFVRIEQLTKEFETASASLTALRKEHDTLLGQHQQAVAAHQQQQLALQKQIHDLQLQLQQQQLSAQKQTAEMESKLHQQQLTSQKQIAEWESKLQQAQTAAQKQLFEVQHQSQALDKQIKAEHDKYTALQAQLQKCKDDAEKAAREMASDFKTKLQKSKDDADKAAREAASDFKTKLQKSKDDAEKAAREAALDFKTKLQKKELELQTLQQNYTAIKKEQEQLGSTAGDREKLVQLLQQQKDKLEQQIKDEQSRVIAAGSQTQTLKLRLGDMEAELEDAEERLRAFAEEKRKLEAQVTELKQKTNQKKGEQDKLIETLQAELSAAKSQKATLEQQVKDATKTAKTQMALLEERDEKEQQQQALLMEKLKMAVAQLAEHDTELKLAASEKQELQNQVRTLQAELAAAKSASVNAAAQPLQPLPEVDENEAPEAEQDVKQDLATPAKKSRVARHSEATPATEKKKKGRSVRASAPEPMSVQKEPENDESVDTGETEGEEGEEAKDPTKCTIQELKAWLTSLNVDLPTTSQKKQYYLDLLYEQKPSLKKEGATNKRKRK